jgi:hypothetical protein
MILPTNVFHGWIMKNTVPIYELRLSPRPGDIPTLAH